MITCFVAFLFMAFLSFQVFASVTGTVTDTTGNLVTGAMVTFIDESNPDNRFSDETDDHGNYNIDIYGTTGVDETLPFSFSLGQNYPNPFNPTTTIPFNLEKSGNVRLDIYNITGQHIKTLVDGYYNAGSHSVVWDARDENGNHVSAGVYLYSLSSGGYVKANKMLLLDGGSGYASNSSVTAPSPNGIATPALKTSSTTWTIEIIGANILTYTDSGLVLVDGGSYNFVVTKLSVAVTVTDLELDEEKNVYVQTSDILDYDQTTGTMTVSDASDISVDKIIVLGVSEETPYGALKKVTSVSGGVVQTEDAKLTDLIENGSFRVNGTLQVDEKTRTESHKGIMKIVPLSEFPEKMSVNKMTAGGLSGDIGSGIEVEIPITDDVTTTLYLQVEIPLDFQLDISFFEVDYFRLAVEPELVLGAELQAELASFKKKIDVGSIYFAPITIGLIVLVPKYTIYIEPEIGAYLQADFSITASAKGGIVYDGSNWYPVSEKSFNAGFEDFGIEGNAEFPFGQSFDVLFYGVAGPTVVIEAYVGLEAEVNALTNQSQIDAYVGLRAETGGTLEILTFLEYDYVFTLFEVESELWAITNNLPLADFSYTVLDKSVTFQDISSDTDGSVELWSWDFDSDGIIDSTNRNPSYTYASDGLYNVAFTVRDDLGGANTIIKSVTIGGGDHHDIPDITFVTIPSGTFQMGDEVGDLWNACSPVHSVTVSGFEMSVYEITNAQYAIYLNGALASGDITATSTSVTGNTGTYSEEEYINLSGSWGWGTYNKCWIQYGSGTFTVTSGYEDWPVVCVTWYGAKSFALYYGFDLPTEAEWEYACRGGRQYTYGTDDGTISSSKANYNWNVGHPVDVGSYPMNPFGLYDMSGNVREWCHDWFGTYPSDSVNNPSGAQTGSGRMSRGGGCIDYVSALFCRSAARDWVSPAHWFEGLGLRVVRRVSPQNY